MQQRLEAQNTSYFNKHWVHYCLASCPQENESLWHIIVTLVCLQVAEKVILYDSGKFQHSDIQEEKYIFSY